MTAKPEPVRLEPASEKSEHGDWNIWVGRKAVMVGADLYGYAMYQAAGANGAFYYFRQAGGEDVGDVKKVGKMDRERFNRIEVWSDKTEQWRQERDAKGNRPRVAPFKERLQAKAEELVRSGKLIPKREQLARVEANRQREAAREAAREEKELETLRARARRAVKDHDTLTTEELVRRVVEAMQWAQTQ